MFNLVIMAYMWSACSVSYFMINYFIAALPGDTYDNFYASGCAEAFSPLFSSVIYASLSTRATFIVNFAITIFGALCVIILGTPYPELMPMFVIITKVGICGAYIFSWVAPMGMFPTLF